MHGPPGPRRPERATVGCLMLLAGAAGVAVGMAIALILIRGG